MIKLMLGLGIALTAAILGGALMAYEAPGARGDVLRSPGGTLSATTWTVVE